MKKLPIIMLSSIMMPALAFGSDTSLPHGLQVGLGVSATSGLNMFVGYNNKNFD